MLRGKPQLEARLHAIGKTETMLRGIQIRGVFLAKQNTRKFRKTGNLGRTIRFGPVDARHAVIYAGGQLQVGYAAAVEFGTRPHIIRPRNAKVLAWGGPRTLGGRLRVSGGVQARPTHFAKLVHHPGTRAQPYLVPGLRQAASEEGLGSLVKAWNAAA